MKGVTNKLDVNIRDERNSENSSNLSVITKRKYFKMINDICVAGRGGGD